MPSEASPAPDAALFPFGKQRMRQTLRGAIAAGALAFVMPVACVVYGYGVGAWIFAVLWFLAFGGVAAFMAWAGWADREAYLAFDATGVWWRHDRTRDAVIPWASLDSVGVYWCSSAAGNAAQRLMSLELSPTGGVQDQDPVLSALIHEDPTDPPGVPGVAARRYRIGIPEFATRHYGSMLIEAARSRAAHLWVGEHERPSGYLRLENLIS